MHLALRRAEATALGGHGSTGGDPGGVPGRADQRHLDCTSMERGSRNSKMSSSHLGFLPSQSGYHACCLFDCYWVSLDFRNLVEIKLGFSLISQKVKNCVQGGQQQPRHGPLLPAAVVGAAPADENFRRNRCRIARSRKRCDGKNLRPRWGSTSSLMGIDLFVTLARLLARVSRPLSTRCIQQQTALVGTKSW